MKLDSFDEQLDTLVANAVNDDMRRLRLHDLNRQRRKFIYISILQTLVIILLSLTFVRSREDTVFPLVFGIPLICGIPGYINIVSELRLLRIAGALKESFAAQTPSEVAGD